MLHLNVRKLSLNYFVYLPLGSCDVMAIIAAMADFPCLDMDTVKLSLPNLINTLLSLNSSFLVVP